MAEINEQLVRYIARLARLDFDDTEITAFTEKFSNILSHVDQLNELNVDDCPPTFHVLPVPETMREDIVVGSFPVDDILSNAPDRKADFFRVPRVVE